MLPYLILLYSLNITHLWLIAVWRTLFALKSIISMGINKVELSWIELTLKRQTAQFSQRHRVMTALKDRRADYRNRTAFRVGLSVCNEELISSNAEFGGAQTAAHMWNQVSLEPRRVLNHPVLVWCYIHTLSNTLTYCTAAFLSFLYITKYIQPKSWKMPLIQRHFRAFRELWLLDVCQMPN